MTTQTCRDGCGREAVDPGACGWEYLNISKRWRCPVCRHALDLVNQQQQQGDYHGVKIQDHAGDMAGE